MNPFKQLEWDSSQVALAIFGEAGMSLTQPAADSSDQCLPQQESPSPQVSSRQSKSSMRHDKPLQLAVHFAQSVVNSDVVNSDVVSQRRSRQHPPPNREQPLSRHIPERKKAASPTGPTAFSQFACCTPPLRRLTFSLAPITFVIEVSQQVEIPDCGERVYSKLKESQPPSDVTEVSFISTVGFPSSSTSISVSTSRSGVAR